MGGEARSQVLDDALRIPGWETSRNPHRVVFTASEDPMRIVVWRITADELSRHVERLRPDAQAVWGRSSTPGEYLLSVHVIEALDTFEGLRGEMCVEPYGLRVEPMH